MSIMKITIKYIQKYRIPTKENVYFVYIDFNNLRLNIVCILRNHTMVLQTYTFVWGSTLTAQNCSCSVLEYSKSGWFPPFVVGQLIYTYV